MCEAIAFLRFALCWDLRLGKEWMPVFIDGERRVHTQRADVLERFLPAAQEHELAVGLPAAKHADPGRSTVLWCWVEGNEQMGHARRFRPAPALALKVGDGSRRLLLWLLDASAPYEDVLRANKRLAYCLRAPQVNAAPERLRVPLPGSYAHTGRRNPAAITVTRMELEEHPIGRLVGRLREPPPRREFARAA